MVYNYLPFMILPLYSGIKQEFRRKMAFLGNIYVPLAWRNQYCGIFTCQQDGVTFSFVDNEYYFKRTALYGSFDDAERFAFFSVAILEMMRAINFYPDIFHANDWQTALVPVYYYLFYYLQIGSNPLQISFY